MRRNNNNSDPAWTAKRCQHLLRQLVVAISVLRRELNQAKFAAKKTPVKRLVEDRKEENFAAGPFATPPTGGNDPDWMPKPGNKTSKFTARRYAARNRQHVQVPERRSLYPRSGIISIATPYLSKIAQGIPLSSPFFDLKDDRQRESVDAEVRRTDFGTASSKLVKAFHDLMAATEPPRPKRKPPLLRTAANCEPDEDRGRTGASSLRSMCLRKVPAVIALEEQEQEELVPPEERVDVTSEMYAELEELGVGIGWPPLREVVRAHGVAMVAEAVEEGLASLQTVIMLMEAFAQESRHGTIREAETLMAAYCRVEYVKRQLRENMQTCVLPLDVMNATRVERRLAVTSGTRIRVITDMLGIADIPFESTLGCQPHIWRAVMLVITDPGPPRAADAAFAFLEIAFGLGCGLATASEKTTDYGDGDSAVPENLNADAHTISLTSTMSSALTIFASVSIVGCEDVADLSCTSPGIKGCLRALVCLSLEIMAAIEMFLGNSSPTTTAAAIKLRRCRLVLTATLLVLLIVQPHNPPSSFVSAINPQRLTTSLRKLDRLADKIRLPRQLAQKTKPASLIIETAKSCARIKGEPSALPRLKELIIRLTQFQDKSLGPDDLQVLKRLGLATATHAATTAKNEDFGRFTAELERQLDLNTGKAMSRPVKPERQRPATESPENDDLAAHGFQWEDGIDELIAATPAVVNKIRNPQVRRLAFVQSKPCANPVEYWDAPTDHLASPDIKREPSDASDNESWDTGKPDDEPDNLIDGSTFDASLDDEPDEPSFGTTAPSPSPQPPPTPQPPQQHAIPNRKRKRPELFDVLASSDSGVQYPDPTTAADKQCIRPPFVHLSCNSYFSSDNSVAGLDSSFASSTSSCAARIPRKRQRLASRQRTAQLFAEVGGRAPTQRSASAPDLVGAHGSRLSGSSSSGVFDIWDRGGDEMSEEDELA
jgi:hypothetical protein